uniref:Uncharacterized protein n=1 Tax=Panagrolaimus sp. ES5 TaxID=591445 RepID=A0AC34GMI6_9BILA
EPQNIALTFDLIELSPLKNARFSQKRQDSAETCTDIPKSDSNHHFSNSREDTSFLNPVKGVKNDGIVGDDFLEGFSPATPDVDNDQDVFVDAFENVLKTDEPHQKNQENKTVSNPTHAKLMDNLLPECGNTTVNQGIDGVNSICGRY